MGRKVYGDVRRMTLPDLRRELEILGPFIRDVVAAKQARIGEISREIERRERQNGRKTGRPEGNNQPVGNLLMIWRML